MSNPSRSHLSSLHYAYGRPLSTAIIRRCPEDFQVDEKLSFSLDGQGQHVYLRIQKRNLNTEQVAKSLARFASVKQVAVGYAGLKDKNAVTSQWFSVDLAGKPEPEWKELETEELKICEASRHIRKLKRGAIAANHFKLTLSQFEGDKEDVVQRLNSIKKTGVPNYFGEQRFGRNDANLKQAEKLITGELKRIKRHLRGIYLSAVRSFLFNQVLSQRVSNNSWASPLEGDVFMLDGTRSIFSPEAIDDEIRQRVELKDIHPSGPMWGLGELSSKDEVLLLENEMRDKNVQWCAFLENAGLKQERRALRLPVRGLQWEWKNDDLLLVFSLAPGSYATSVLRELVMYN